MDQISQILFGLTRNHLLGVGNGVLLHKDVLEPFFRLRTLAAAQGIDLVIASGFRDFERQLAIWNGKAEGCRPVNARDGSTHLDVATLSDQELLFAILRWSALPGTSRHHWGTDMDVWDANAVPPGYVLQLEPAEYSASGPFARLAEWLSSEEVHQSGFFRPYRLDTGGVSPEPWHLSYRPLAATYRDCFCCDDLRALITSSEIALKPVILSHLDEIYRRYVQST